MPNEQIPKDLQSGFVNAWKPVTEAYQRIELPSVDQVLQFSAEGKAAVPVKRLTTPKLPLAIAIFGWFYMVRAAVYIVFVFVLLSQPDSGFASVLVQ